MSAAVVSLLSTRHFSLQSERELSGRAATSSSRRHPHSRSARVQVHARLDAGDDGEEPDAESEGPSKRARQNARRRERQREKTARAEAKKSKEKLQALAKELEGIKPEAPPAPAGPASSFRVVRRSVIEATLPCLGCAGKVVVTCSRCVGAGRLSVGGWHAKNNINRSKLAGTKWTSIEKTLGYDFFTATSTRKQAGASGRVTWLVEMAAAGDPTVRLWVPESIVADRTAWIAGWKDGIWQVPGGAERIAWLRERESVTCPHCGGLGQVPCPECSGVDRPAAAMT